VLRAKERWEVGVVPVVTKKFEIERDFARTAVVFDLAGLCELRSAACGRWFLQLLWRLYEGHRERV